MKRALIPFLLCAAVAGTCAYADSLLQHKKPAAAALEPPPPDELALEDVQIVHGVQDKQIALDRAFAIVREYFQAEDAATNARLRAKYHMAEGDTWDLGTRKITRKAATPAPATPPPIPPRR